MYFYLKGLLFLLFLIFFTGCSSEINMDYSEESQEIEVAYITLEKQEVPFQQELSGRIKSIYKSEVRPQIDGIINNLPPVTEKQFSLSNEDRRKLLKSNKTK